MPAAFNTAEFRRSNGPQFHNAVSAWADGHTGTGVAIAIVDTGIDTTNTEFAGRISPASRALAGGATTIQAEDAHGTHVALFAAAARDNSGIVGMAPDATLMVLRVDQPGTCGNSCVMLDSVVARGIDHAVANGARVINISLNGSPADTASRNAIAAAAAAGVVMVVSAGNDALDNPDRYAASVLAAGGDHVIIAGAVGATGHISSFSNRAGNADTAPFVLMALGEGLCCLYEGSQIFTDANGNNRVLLGTSFSAPQISGAVALLAQAFPNLTGREIVQILLDSAHDVGDPGVDAIYGRGILNMARALAPSGATSLAGTTSTLSLSASTAAGSAAMGDALGTASLGTVMLDGYKRAYRVDLARGLRSAPLMPRLTARLAARQQGFAGTLANASFAFTVDGQGVRPNLSGANPLQLDAQDAEAARVLAARVALRLSPATQIGFAHAESADGLAVQMRGADRPAFFMARHALADMGFEAENGLAVALRHQMGGWGITASAQAGRVLSDAPLEVFQRLRAERQREAMASFGVAADRQFGPLKAAFGLTWLAEDNTILGARFHDALGGKGADTLFADAEAGWAFAPGWQVTGAFRQGWSRTRGGGVIVAGSQFASRGWSVDVERQGVLGTKDRLGLRLGQPLRVERGGLSLDLPVGYDYASGAATNAVTRLNLAPEGRELMGELHWGGPLWAGWGSAGVFYRREPGHFAALPDDKGMAIRWQGAF